MQVVVILNTIIYVTHVIVSCRCTVEFLLNDNFKAKY